MQQRSIAFFFLSFIFSLQADNKALMQQLVQQLPCVPTARSLITPYEWQELKMQQYVDRFDRAITLSGRWGLRQWSEPVGSLEQIKLRQESIAQLKKGPEILQHCCNLLERIADLEVELLAYFDEHDKLNSQAKQLYYQFFSRLNNNKIALDCVYVSDIFQVVRKLVTTLCITGFASEIVGAISAKRPIKIQNMFTRLYKNHALNDDMYQQYKQEGLLDAAPPNLQSAVANTHVIGWLWQKLKQKGSQLGNSIQEAMPGFAIMQNGTFGDKWSYISEQTYKNLGDTLAEPLAFGSVAALTAYGDYQFGVSVYRHSCRLAFIYKTHVALQQRLVHMKNYMSNIQELLAVAQSIPALHMHPCIKQARALFDHAQTTAEMKQLLALFEHGTFDEPHNVWYSRGNVLLAHRLIDTIKKQLIPALQAVGLIDGFMTLARHYQAYKNDRAEPWCFVTFEHVDEPMLHITDGWLPLIPGDTVANTVMLGMPLSSQHLLLTGPNGGGKSSMLKMIGGATVLAHAWGMVPARACSMTLVHGVRTSFDPKEDVTKGLSTFMAQKKRLNHCLLEAQKSHENNRVLLLIDEPYRGTIEAEAEKRAYTFGKLVSEQPYAQLVMASHLKEPIALESHTGMFANMQLEMIEPTDEHVPFKFTYRLMPGAAWWWFKDIEKRMAVIDWLQP